MRQSKFEQRIHSLEQYSRVNAHHKMIWVKPLRLVWWRSEQTVLEPAPSWQSSLTRHRSSLMKERRNGQSPWHPISSSHDWWIARAHRTCRRASSRTPQWSWQTHRSAAPPPSLLVTGTDVISLTRDSRVVMEQLAYNALSNCWILPSIQRRHYWYSLGRINTSTSSEKEMTHQLQLPSVKPKIWSP